MLTTIIRFVNIILVALLAGTSFGIWVGLNPADYLAATYIDQQQHLVLSLQTLLVSLVIVATLVTIASAFLQRKDKKTFIALLVAALFLLLCIIITRFGNLPIQTEMLTWDIHSVPGNWTILRDQWWSFHIQRTVAELIALVLVTWTSVQKSSG
ncbi:MAG TPA: anthrone oxygenase family protein [Chryseolinea sp.]